MKMFKNSKLIKQSNLKANTLSKTPSKNINSSLNVIYPK